MNTYQISCTVGTTDSTVPLGLEIWLDNQQLWVAEHVTQSTPLVFDLPEDEADHEFKFVMKNKTSSHTCIDKNGNIVSDARLVVSDVAFDQIKLGHTFVETTTYTHNFNSTQSSVVEPFYGELGCNGTVSFKFSTPIYLWLLEHM